MTDHPRRRSVAAGRFYPNDPALLLRQIEACYTHPLGPDPMQPAVTARPPLALIVPHGALGHSGPVTAHAFAVAEHWSRCTGESPSRVVLLGPDHFGCGAPISATLQEYGTPFGTLQTAWTLLADLCTAAAAESSPPWLAVAEAGHDREHALENVLPFLQHHIGRLNPSDAGPRPRRFTVPELLPLTLTVQDFAVVKHLAELLLCRLPTEGTLVIATSDLCHCGPAYGDEPVSGQSLETYCRRRAGRVAEVLGQLDAERLIAAYHQEAWSTCGITGLAATIYWARLRGATEIRPLQLATSVAVARTWNDHPTLPKDGAGALLYPWSLLTDADAGNPVGFGSFAVL